MRVRIDASRPALMRRGSPAGLVWQIGKAWSSGQRALPAVLLCLLLAACAPVRTAPPVTPPALPAAVTALPPSPTAPGAAATRAALASAAPSLPPPTPLPTRALTPTPPPTAAALQPTPTVACQDNLAYLDDLTIPDGTVVNRGAAVDKRWQVQNTGGCNWNEGYSLRCISGNGLGAPDQLALYPARSGAQAVLRIVFTAPDQPGSYRSAWQAYDPFGRPFGDPVFMEIIVN